MLEENKTHCGDNVELCRQLADDSIDLVVTSPPYDDMTLDYEPITKDGMRDYKGYTWEFKALSRELYRVVKGGGVVVWVVGDPVVDGSESLASSLQKIYFHDVGFRIHDTMIYQKNGPAHPESVRYYQVFEYAFVLSKGAPASFSPLKDRKNRWANSFGTKSLRGKDGELMPQKKRKDSGEYGVRFNIWKYNTGSGFHGDPLTHEHPASFPEKLAHDMIVSWSCPGDMVLDPFMGSGTTGKMALQTGRRFLGFELSEEYTALANKRVKGANLPLFEV